jgi:glycosyltransferase involved in cell wall biosynthesis
MDENERISVIVPTHNRATYLSRQLAGLAEMFDDELDAGSLEILVFDDGSTDSTPHVCEQYARQITYLRSDHNVGAIEARRRLMAASTGAILLHLDDDSYVLDPNALVLIRQYFAAHERCAIIAANVATRSHPAGLVPSSQGPVAVPVFTGCGCALRASALAATGYYPPFLRGIQAEEEALSLRLLDAGFDAVLLPALRIYHAEEPVQRREVYRRAQTVANQSAIIVAYYPLPLIALAVLHKVIRHSWFNLRCRTFREFFGDAAPLLLPSLRLGWTHRRPIAVRTLLLVYRRTRSYDRFRRETDRQRERQPWSEVAQFTVG